MANIFVAIFSPGITTNSWTQTFDLGMNEAGVLPVCFLRWANSIAPTKLFLSSFPLSRCQRQDSNTRFQYDEPSDLLPLRYRNTTLADVKRQSIVKTLPGTTKISGMGEIENFPLFKKILISFIK
jgi:hypothetical protein